MTSPRTTPVSAAMLVAAAVCAFAASAAGQVRTRRVIVGRYTHPAEPVPGGGPAAGSTLVGLACRTETTGGRAVNTTARSETHCRVVPARVADPGGEYATSLAACYGLAGTPLPPPGAAVANAVRRVVEGGSMPALLGAEAHPAGTPPVLVVTRETDVGDHPRCVRWTRHNPCRGLDCGMTPVHRWCAAEVIEPHHVNGVATSWAWISEGAMRRVSTPRFRVTEILFLRFESVALDAGDPHPERATIGALDAAGLRALAAHSADPVARYAAWVNLAVDAWNAGDTAVVREATERAARTLPDARAAAPEAARAALEDPERLLANEASEWSGADARERCGTAAAR